MALGVFPNRHECAICFFHKHAFRQIRPTLEQDMLKSCSVSNLSIVVEKPVVPVLSSVEATIALLYIVFVSMIILNPTSNLTELRFFFQIYKIKDAELTVGNLLDSVVTRIATKDLISV